MTPKPPIRAALTTTAAVAALLSIAGCAAPADPYTSKTPPAPATTQPGPSATADRGAPVTERPDDLAPAPRPVPAPSAPSTPARTPGEAARRYAATYVNWTWRTYAAQQRQLTALATGKLHAALTRSPPDADQLGILKTQQQTNRGRVLSLGAPARPPRTRTTDDLRAVYVITLEQAGSGDFTDSNQRHGAYQATAQKTPAGWLIAAFTALP